MRQKHSRHEAAVRADLHNIAKYKTSAKKQGLTQDNLARKANIKYSTLTKIEGGVVTKTSVQTIQKIAKSLGVPMDELLKKEYNINMKDLPKGFIVRVLLVIIALLVVGGGVYIYKTKKAEQPIITPSAEVKSSQKIARIFYTKNNDLYSVTFDKKDSQNISQRTGGVIKATSPLGTKIAYTKQLTTDHTLWIANSDGTNSKEIFRTVNTKCDEIKVLGMNEEGTSLLFTYIHSIEQDVGTCTPITEPTTKNGTYHYGEGKISELPAINEENYLTLNDSKILFVSYGKDWKTTILRLDPTKQKSEMFFELPTELTAPYLNSGNGHFDFRSRRVVINNADSLKNHSQIFIYNYGNNSYEEITAPGGFTAFQHVSVSPNFINITYQNGGALYVYNLMDKSTRKLFDTYGLLFSMSWLDDNSFIFRYPIPSSYPLRNVGSLVKFDLTTNQRETFLEGITDLK